MMSHPQLLLDVTRGPLEGAAYAIDGPGHCLIGRAPDCNLQLSRPDDQRFACVSRHHCEVQVEPETVRVRDLGSRNGTWLNGERLSQSGAYLESEADRQPGYFVELQDGDKLEIGFITIRVRISESADSGNSARRILTRSGADS